MSAGEMEDVSAGAPGRRVRDRCVVSFFFWGGGVWPPSARLYPNPKTLNPEPLNPSYWEACRAAAAGKLTALVISDFD